MIYLPGGQFTMGCVPADRHCEPVEQPAHPVRVAPFWLDKHEVTAAQYDECIDAGACNSIQVTEQNPGDSSSSYLNSRNPERRDHPANSVNFFNARKYCAWAGKRLPTEAEFEYALRGGLNEQIYPWGNDPPTKPVGNFSDESIREHHLEMPWIRGYHDGFVGTSPVCSFPRNPFGFYDLSGNVWEWCEGVIEGEPNLHVTRGGSWHNDLSRLRNSVRHGFLSDGYPHVGLRCARGAN